MSLTFDTQKAVQKLRESGAGEAQAEAMVEVVVEATGALVTGSYLDARLDAGFAGMRAELHHTVLILGLSMAGFVIGVAGVSLAVAALLFD